MTPEITVRARMHSTKGTVLDRSVKLTLSDDGRIVEAEDMAREDGLAYSFIREIVAFEGAEVDNRSFWRDWLDGTNVPEKPRSKNERNDLRLTAQELVQRFVRCTIEGQPGAQMSAVSQLDLAEYEYTQIVSGTRIQLRLEYESANGEIQSREIGSAEVMQIQGIRLINAPAYAQIYYA